MENFRKISWFDFNTLPGEGDLDIPLELPEMDDHLYSLLKEFSGERIPDKIVDRICRLSLLVLERIDDDKYKLTEAESVFRYIYQIARFNGFNIDEYSKRNEILSSLYQVSSELSSYLEDTGAYQKTGEVRLLVLAVLNPEHVIQNLSMGVYDYRPQFIFLVKMLKDPRLKGFLMNALRFYESIPEDELMEERGLYIDNILEAMGNPGWEDFIPILKKYLYYRDEIIPFTAMDSLGIIGGEWALNTLKQFRRQVLEGFLDIGEYEMIALDLNIISASKGAPGLIEEIKKPDISLIKAQIAMRFLASFKSREVIEFIYGLLEDKRCEEAEVHYITEDDDFIRKELRFPLREEALMILQSYDEDYIVSIVGKKFLSRRNTFFNDLMKLYNLKGYEGYWEDDDYLN